jgi:hypothetical protein
MDFQFDETVVYNHKRHDNFSLGGRKLEFRVKPSSPRRLSRKLSREFPLVDLVNNLGSCITAATRSRHGSPLRERVVTWRGIVIRNRLMIW